MTILEYHRPSTPAEALALLRRPEVTTVPIIPCPRPSALYEIKAQAVVDFGGLNLNYVSVEEGQVRLGAMTPLQTIVESSQLLSAVQGILPETARLAGHWGLRQMATLQGALLSRKKLPELTLALFALDAAAVVIKSDGSQLEMPLAEYLAVQWSADELMLEVKWQAEAGGDTKIGGAVERVARAPRDGAVMAAAAVLRIEKTICRQARVALSHAGSGAELMVAFIPRLEGQAVTPSLLQGVAETVKAAVKPLTDFRASADYRREMAGVLTRRALEMAWKRASA